MSVEQRFSYDNSRRASLGNAGMLPAIRGIQPRILCEAGAPNITDCKLFAQQKPSGNMPDGASRMLPLPNQQRCAPFRLRMLMLLLCAFFPSIAFGQSESE